MGTFLFSRVGDIGKRTELAPTVLEVEKHKR